MTMKPFTPPVYPFRFTTAYRVATALDAARYALIDRAERAMWNSDTPEEHACHRATEHLGNLKREISYMSHIDSAATTLMSFLVVVKPEDRGDMLAADYVEHLIQLITGAPQN